MGTLITFSAPTEKTIQQRKQYIQVSERAINFRADLERSFFQITDSAINRIFHHW